jgi:glyoxylase-like metal-dependent hydrolase (beta-lactamase superfamily II)
MRTFCRLFFLSAFSTVAWVESAVAQKVYWATSGTFGPFDIQSVLPTYPESRPVRWPVNTYIIDHPMGLVVFDTGNNVAISDGNCTAHWSAGVCNFSRPEQSRDQVIDRQLEKIGYGIDDVKIVITSHSHLDHIGNIEMFPDAIHVIQKLELYQAWWPEKFQRGFHVMADYDEARDFNYHAIEGDYDLFGDGSVIVLSTPGHTLGHQSVKVRLPESGTIIIAQDAIWMAENLEGHPPLSNYSVLDVNKSVDRLTMMRDLEDAKLWLGHDLPQYETFGDRWHK